MPSVKGTPIDVQVVGLDEVLAGIDRLEVFAARHAISIPRSSRLGLYIAVLRGLESGRLVHRGAPDVGGAMLELRQLIAIVDGLKANPSLAMAFRRLLDGHYLTLDAPTRDPGRDKQFELFVAARLALGGLATELAEPDIVIDLCGERVGIAAKRPRTPGGIKSAIQKGRGQVRKASQRGFLALDASMYPIPNGRVIAAFLDNVGDGPRATAERLQSIVAENIDVLRPSLMEEPERSGTLGMLLHLAVPFMVDGDRGFTASVGEAWLVLPARLRLFPALAPLVRCLGPSAQVLGSRPPVPGPARGRVSESP